MNKENTSLKEQDLSFKNDKYDLILYAFAISIHYVFDVISPNINYWTLNFIFMRRKNKPFFRKKKSKIKSYLDLFKKAVFLIWEVTEIYLETFSS